MDLIWLRHICLFELRLTVASSLDIFQFSHGKYKKIVSSFPLPLSLPLSLSFFFFQPGRGFFTLLIQSRGCFPAPIGRPDSAGRSRAAAKGGKEKKKEREREREGAAPNHITGYPAGEASRQKNVVIASSVLSAAITEFQAQEKLLVNGSYLFLLTCAWKDISADR